MKKLEIEVFATCDKCGSDLNIEPAWRSDYGIKIKVKPCETCMESARIETATVRKSNETRGNFAASFDVEEDA